MALPTPTEIGDALAHLENYRVLRVQELVYLAQGGYSPIPASAVLSLGFRETTLRNVCGGATWDEADKKWIQAYSDRGWLQIADTIDHNAKWLAKQEGCEEGKWTPAVPPVNALTPRHVPRFTQGTEYALQELKGDYAFAKKEKISDPLRFAIAAYNAGAGGAFRGYREGDVDKYTAHGDYSKTVLAIQPLVHDWIVAHPHWVYKPASGASPSE